jgi:hypothetical protein
MKITIILLVVVFMALAGCATRTMDPAATEKAFPMQVEILEETPTEITVRMKRPQPKPPPDKPPPAAVTKLLPPCVSVAGDKRTALQQKFDCLIETADIPATAKPK